MRRSISLLAAALTILFLCTTPAALAEAPALQTITVQSPDNTPSAWLTSGDEASLSSMDLTQLVIGTDDDGATRAVLLWLPLPAAIPTESVQSATLSLLPTKGDTPAVRAGRATQLWTLQNATWDTMHTAVDQLTAPGTLDADGWYTIDVTDIVKAWLSGDASQYGFLLQGDGTGGLSLLYSGTNTQPAQCPKLTVTYAPQTEPTRYGRFDYTEQAVGNCLAYALRDTSPIYYDALIQDTSAFQAAYDDGGESGALAYFANQVFEYISTHQEALGIAAFRRLDAYDSEIDVTREYRVGLRIGFHERNGVDGIQVDEDFDFHLRAQLADGSWAEKVPAEPSRVTPGSNAGADIGKDPWDQSFLWGYEKWSAYYDSDVVYFAVEKSTDAFTQHKPVEE